MVHGTPSTTKFRKSPTGKKSPPYKISRRVQELTALAESAPSAPPPLKTPEAKKRQLSDDGALCSESKKKDSMSSDEKNFQALTASIKGLGKSLSSKIDESKAEISKDLTVQLDGVRNDIVGLKNDLHDLDIKVEARVAVVEDRQDASDARINTLDKKLAIFQGNVESEFRSLKQLVESGPAAPLSKSNLSYDELHERELQGLINEAKSMVTVVNTQKVSLTTKEMAALLTLQGFLTKGDSKSLLSVARMGAPRSLNSPYRLKMDSPSSAQELLEKSRSDPRDSSEGNLVKIFPYCPAPYAAKQREFRDMAAMLASEGYLTRVDFEGTTMVLKAKARAEGGHWCIVRGGSFRPLTTGRETATENEDPGVAAAREKLSRLFTPEGLQPLAHSLTLMTKDKLADENAIFKKLGAKAKEFYVSYKELPTAVGNRNHYRIFFKNRDNARSILSASQEKDSVEVNLDSTDFLKFTMPWVV